MSRDTTLGINFAGVMFYDGQGFMVSKDLGVSSVKDLSGANICVQSGTTTELNMADYFCGQWPRIHAGRVRRPSGSDRGLRRRPLRRLHHRLLGSGRGPYPLRQSERLRHPARNHLERAARPVRAVRVTTTSSTSPSWVYFAILEAEELGVTSENVDEMLVVRKSVRSSVCSASKAISARRSVSTRTGPTTSSSSSVTMARCSKPMSVRTPPWVWSVA